MTRQKMIFKKLLAILLILSLEVSYLPVVSVWGQEAAVDASSSAAVEPFLQERLPSIDPLLQEVIDEKQETKLTLDQQNINSSAQIRQGMRLRELSKKDFKAGEDIVAVVDNASSDNVTLSLKHVLGKEIEVISREIVYGESRIFKILPPSSLTPGKYTLTAQAEGGKAFTQDFTWGVLALNTNKSIYTPSEKAYLAFGVLDEKGDMVCDASLQLVITNPDEEMLTLSTENGEIRINPECSIKDKVEKPDYEASFTVNGVGTYTMTLTAKTGNGDYQISHSFEVRESVPFDVERFAPTRIFPVKEYDVTLKITAHEDFEGVISEMVPESFAITKQSGTRDPEVTDGVLGDKADDVLGAAVVRLGMPFDGKHEMTLGFGEQIQDPSLKKTYEQFGLSGHDGLDFDMPVGTPVLAADEGTVTLAKNSDYGLTVVIQHAFGKTYYGHLSKITTPLGTVVTKGQQIGFSGNSGLSTGAHLHFGVKPTETEGDNGYFGKVNPEAYLDDGREAEKGNYAVKFINWHVKLKKGEVTKLTYTYDAPNKSPDFYTTGPLAFHAADKEESGIVFQEARQWQIAVDSAGTDMMLFWDPANGAAPTGWTVVTTYDGRFPRGESVANVLATGGNATHTPTVNGSVTLSAPSLGGNGGSTRTAASYGHAHGTPSVTIGNASNLPAFRSMQLIQYDTGIPTTIPANAIAMFDASPGMPGSGWTRVTTQDNRIVRVNTTVATGGADTHTHTLTWGALTASSGTVSNAGNTNNAGADTGHTHTAPSATNSDSQTSLPPYVSTVFASANSNTSVPIGMIAMFDGDPGSLYFTHSESGGAYYQQFIRGNTAANAGTTGGTSTHSHGSAVSGVSGANSIRTRGSTGTGTVEARDGHTHTLSASFNTNDNHTPQYFNVVIGERINAPALQQYHYRWRNDDGSETTATWRRSEDVAATADNGVNRRLRMLISNEGSLTSGSITYRLEYGQKSTTCAAIGSWIQVPATATTEDFEMHNTANLTDGNSTTNVSGGLTDENTTFVAGQVKDTGSQTGGITLDITEFTEIEFSIKPSANPTAGEEFCFRLTNAGSTTNFTYTTYAEVTVGDPVLDLKHYRWREDDGTEGDVAGNTLYFNPTGDGFASDFTVQTGCTDEWDCVDDGSADTSATAPTNDGATSDLTMANGISYFTLADGALPAGSTVTRLDVYIYAIDVSNPNTNVQVGYCTTCNGSNNVLGGSQTVSVASYTQYTSAFTSLSLSTTDMNNMQIVVSADRNSSRISTAYAMVTYTIPGASWKQVEDTAHTNQATGSNIRLRVSVANTGDIPANRNYRLEYAAKVGGSCGDDETFTTVPVTATSEHFEMTTSTQFSDGAATTTQLTATGLGTFSAGKMIEDPSNSSGTFVATNGQYSEFEYNFQANGSASGSYCFRVTDNGTVLDAYTVYPELSMFVAGPTLDQLLRHGAWFSSGVEQPFTF